NAPDRHRTLVGHSGMGTDGPPGPRATGPAARSKKLDALRPPAAARTRPPGHAAFGDSGCGRTGTRGHAAGRSRRRPPPLHHPARRLRLAGRVLVAAVGGLVPAAAGAPRGPAPLVDPG